MRHITKVEIRGWQSHAHTVLHLHPGINAITGSSNAGKSTIFRALRWALLNEAPEGPVEDWQRRGATLTQVTVTFSDGLTITRERRAGRNIYEVTAPDGKQTKLADFGTVLPPVVIQHGMLPVTIDQDLTLNLHYASQMEPALFVASPPYSAPARARILGYLSGVGVIDRAQRQAKSDLLAIGQSVKSQEAELARLSGQLSTYAGLDAQDAAMQQAEVLLAQIPEIGQRIARLQEIARRRLEIEIGIAQAQVTLARLVNVDQAVAALAKLEVAQQQIERLELVSYRLISAEQGVAAAQTILDRTQGFEQAVQALTSLDTARHTREALQRITTAHQQALTGRQAAQQILGRTAGADAALATLQAITADADRRTQLQRIAATFTTARQGVITAQRTLTRTAQIAAADAALLEIDRITRTRQQLLPIRDRLVAAHRGAEQAQQTADRLQWIPQVQAAIAEMDPIRQRITALQGVAVRITGARRQVSDTHQTLTNVSSRLEAQIAQYVTALTEAQICPTCEQLIDPKSVARIAANLTEVHTHAA